MNTIVLGVTSSVSIYKACEIVRGFQKNGRQVQVVMTPNATKLISPRLFSAISGRRVIAELFGEDDPERIGHISLADEAALLVVAPATANIIGKFAAGVADDFLSTLFLAVRCPVLIAPAMNQAMYVHPHVQANILKLRSVGVDFVLPEKGYLACREEGWGRLAQTEEIISRGLTLLQMGESLKEKTVLVTAGPTREPFDPVRFISNRSSGKMGYAIAEEAQKRGANVLLISGPTALFPPSGVGVRTVETAEEMSREVKAAFPQSDIVIMTAAVSDFRPARISGRKIKKQEAPKSILLTRTEDILENLSQLRGRRGKIVVGFAAETENIEANASKKLTKKKLDLVVANNVLREGVGFESDSNQVTIIDRKGAVFETEKMSKREISRFILDRIEGLLEKKRS
jgi:phosphopantothenoylcysteine decarboxylase/phosphopantothenate--cysteine ligase